MSRIGKKPVSVPSGVKVAVSGGAVAVEGPKGKLKLQVDPRVTVKSEGASVVCVRANDEQESRALHGLYRNLISNMIEGVTKGFEKKLEIMGVGFNAQLKGKELALTVGFANQVKLPIPEGITIQLADPTHISVVGADKQAVGQFAANIRAVRKPEPYKGTGIRYQGEQVRRKAGKAFGSGG